MRFSLIWPRIIGLAMAELQAHPDYELVIYNTDDSFIDHVPVLRDIDGLVKENVDFVKRMFYEELHI